MITISLHDNNRLIRKTIVRMFPSSFAATLTVGVALMVDTLLAGALLSVVISIIVLSIGAPGVPGSGLICLSVLLTQLGVPVEAVGLVMGIDPLVGMLRCMSNCLGDVAVSCIVAKREGILDEDAYKYGA